MLIVIAGLPGVGKSAVAEAVATELGAVRRRGRAYEPWRDCVRVDAASALDEVVRRVTGLVSTRS